MITTCDNYNGNQEKNKGARGKRKEGEGEETFCLFVCLTYFRSSQQLLSLLLADCCK